MKVVLFGATGMVGQGVLRECLEAPDVAAVLSVARRSVGATSPKLTELLREDLFDLGPVAEQLSGYDACFFCLGVSSAGRSEAEYRRVTFDLTISVARLLAERNPTMVFTYVSGAGTDPAGRAMWARVKGETENELLRMPFRAAYMFRPGVIRAMHGERSGTRGYRIAYTLLLPIVLLVAAVAPSSVTTTVNLGRAMLNAVRREAPSRWLSTRQINELAR